MRNGLRLFFRKLHIDGLEHVPEKGPVLLVANHPNAFLDALLIASFTKRPIHFLARGDAFRIPVLGAIFRSYNMLPVYRISEGKENLSKNTSTFDASQVQLQQQGMVLIFGEGRCEQNWDLRPLKKGPARIAERAWNDPQSENLVVIPIGLTYEHFEGGGKSMVMRFGKPITKSDNGNNVSGAAFVKWLNGKLREQFNTIAYVNPKLQPQSAGHDTLMQNWKHAEEHNLNILTTLHQPPTGIKPISASWLPSAFHKGLVTLPHYWMMQRISKLFTAGTIFYDSIFFALLVLLLPFYIGTIVYLIAMFLSA